MERNERIILEYSYLPLFRSLSERKWNEYEETLIPLYFLKTSNFHSLQNWKELEGIKLDLMNFLPKLPKYPYIYSTIYFKIVV